jgi:hypothetical protein
MASSVFPANLGNPPLSPGFRLALAIASLAGMTSLTFSEPNTPPDLRPKVCQGVMLYELVFPHIGSRHSARFPSNKHNTTSLPPNDVRGGFIRCYSKGETRENL